MTTISGTITSSVTLGSGAWLSPLTITNTGKVYGSASRPQGGVGVVLPSAGNLVNAGQISGGIGFSSYPPELGVGGTGVALLAGGTVTNTGLITGGLGFGLLGAAGAGVVLASGGTLTNFGTIEGGTGTRPASGVVMQSGGTVSNYGTISASGTGVPTVQFGPAAATLIAGPGAVFNGPVVADATAGDVLELAGTSPGTLDGLGSRFLNFSAIDFRAGAHWFVAGNASGLTGTLSGFAAGDTIEFSGVTATGSSYSGGVLTLDQAGGAEVTLDLPGAFATTSFRVSNGPAGADITLAALETPCFAAGTRILTAGGEVPVEALHPGGDRVATLDVSRLTKIVWLGRRYIDCTRRPRPADVWPIRIRAGALGDGAPARDLLLSPDHAVFVAGVLVPVRHLVNGRTIAQERVAEVTYYHVELAAHGVILADGLPCESYLDTGNRAALAGTKTWDWEQQYPRQQPSGERAVSAQ